MQVFNTSLRSVGFRRADGTDGSIQARELGELPEDAEGTPELMEALRRGVLQPRGPLETDRMVHETSSAQSSPVVAGPAVIDEAVPVVVADEAPSANVSPSGSRRQRREALEEVK